MLSDYPELIKKFDSFKSEVLFNNNSSNSRKSNATIGRSCHHSQINRKIDVFKRTKQQAATYNQNLSLQKELKT
jgi:hypothetical protein